MPPIAPIQVEPGGAPSHAILTRTNFVSAVALHTMARQCICSAKQGLVQRCSAILHHDAAHGSLISPSVLNTAFTCLSKSSAQSSRTRSAWAVITLVKMRVAVRNIILALMLATAVTTVLPEEDLEIFDGCSADTYSVPTRQKISLFHQVNIIITVVRILTKAKLKSREICDKISNHTMSVNKNNTSGVSSHKFKTKIHLTCSHNMLSADTDLQHFILHSCQ